MKERMLEGIADDMLVFFPLFRMLMKGERPCKKPSHQAYAVLGMLLHDGTLQMSEIGKRLCISKPNVTSLTGKLIKEGKVERLPDSEDRRIIKIRITNKGKHFLLGEREKTKENIKRNLKDLENDELGSLWRSLEDIKVIVSRLRGEEKHGRK